MSDYKKWMNRKQLEVKITISPSALEYAEIIKEYTLLTGSTNYYDNPDLYE